MYDNKSKTVPTEKVDICDGSCGNSNRHYHYKGQEYDLTDYPEEMIQGGKIEVIKF